LYQITSMAITPNHFKTYCHHFIPTVSCWPWCGICDLTTQYYVVIPSGGFREALEWVDTWVSCRIQKMAEDQLKLVFVCSMASSFALGLLTWRRRRISRLWRRTVVGIYFIFYLRNIMWPVAMATRTSACTSTGIRRAVCRSVLGHFLASFPGPMWKGLVALLCNIHHCYVCAHINTCYSRTCFIDHNYQLTITVTTTNL